MYQAKKQGHSLSLWDVVEPCKNCEHLHYHDDVGAPWQCDLSGSLYKDPEGCKYYVVSSAEKQTAEVLAGWWDDDRAVIKVEFGGQSIWATDVTIDKQ